MFVGTRKTPSLWAQLQAARATLRAGRCAGFWVLLAASASAQTGFPAPANGPQLPPPPAIAGRLYSSPLPSRDYTALAIGDWLFYPSLAAGLFYDSNPAQLPGGGDQSFGLRLDPSLFAQTGNGIETTTIYGAADGRIGSNASVSGARSLTANAGVRERWEPLPDFTLTANGDYLRQKDLFSGFALNRGVGYLNPTGTGLAPTAEPQSYDQLTASLFAEKTFGHAFAGLGGSVQNLAYERTSALASAPNELTETLTLRGGLWLTPVLYGYAEGSLDGRNSAASALSSNGYRGVVGIGSSRVRLLRGEIYAGYQGESYRAAAIGTISGWVVGGEGDYTPLPRLKLMASLDEALGASFLAPASPATSGTATRVTTILAEAGYEFAPEVSANGRAGFIRSDYVGASRRDNAWTIGATITYAIWRNFGLALDYEHLELNSNVAFESFSRDVVTIGGTYKY